MVATASPVRAAPTTASQSTIRNTSSLTAWSWAVYVPAHNRYKASSDGWPRTLSGRDPCTTCSSTTATISSQTCVGRCSGGDPQTGSIKLLSGSAGRGRGA
ncbi:unnamed protein product [Symbiodinium microadriaticum]|nr:unnamed protein product [Symbiodinium microadriaticum]